MADGDPVRPAAKPSAPNKTALQGLFEEDQAKPAAAEAAPPPASSASVLYDPKAPWPSGIPDLATTLSILRGEIDAPVLLKDQVEALLASLSPEFRELLRDPELDLPPEFHLLARAAAVRWRVMSAQATHKPNARTDPQAIETMFNELDSILAELREVSTDAPPELQGDLSAERIALAKWAVDLSEVIQSATKQEAQQAVAASTEKYRSVPSGTRMLSTSASTGESSGLPPRQKWMAVVLGLSVIGAGIFHGVNLMREPPPPAPVAGLPAGTSGFQPKPGMLVVQSRDGKPLDAVAKEKLKADAEAKNASVLFVSPNSAVVVPNPSPRNEESKP